MHACGREGERDLPVIKSFKFDIEPRLRFIIPSIVQSHFSKSPASFICFPYRFCQHITFNTSRYGNGYVCIHIIRDNHHYFREWSVRENEKRLILLLVASLSFIERERERKQQKPARLDFDFVRHSESKWLFQSLFRDKNKFADTFSIQRWIQTHKSACKRGPQQARIGFEDDENLDRCSDGMWFPKFLLKERKVADKVAVFQWLKSVAIVSMRVQSRVRQSHRIAIEGLGRPMSKRNTLEADHRACIGFALHLHLSSILHNKHFFPNILQDIIQSALTP